MFTLEGRDGMKGRWQDGKTPLKEPSGRLWSAADESGYPRQMLRREEKSEASSSKAPGAVHDWLRVLPADASDKVKP